MDTSLAISIVFGITSIALALVAGGITIHYNSKAKQHRDKVAYKQTSKSFNDIYHHYMNPLNRIRSEESKDFILSEWEYFVYENRSNKNGMHFISDINFRMIKGTEVEKTIIAYLFLVHKDMFDDFSKYIIKNQTYIISNSNTDYGINPNIINRFTAYCFYLINKEALDKRLKYNKLFMDLEILIEEWKIEDEF